MDYKYSYWDLGTDLNTTELLMRGTHWQSPQERYDPKLRVWVFSNNLVRYAWNLETSECTKEEADKIIERLNAKYPKEEYMVIDGYEPEYISKK